MWVHHYSILSNIVILNCNILNAILKKPGLQHKDVTLALALRIELVAKLNFNLKL